MLDSLVPISDQLPETTRITFLQRAVQQNHDLRQIHVMDSVWRFKTESTDTLTFETYYNLLWDAAYQYDLHHTKKGPQRKAFLSQQEEFNDENEYAIEEEQLFTDPEPEEHSPYSVYQSSFHPKMSQKSYLPPKIWETLSESTKQMIIEHNKKVKLNNPTLYTSGSKAKPNPTMGKPNPAPQQVHQHSQNDAKEEPPPDTSTQTLVNKCLAESGIDPTDIQNVMSVSHAKRNISSHDSSRKIHTHQRYVFTRVNQSNHHLIDENGERKRATISEHVKDLYQDQVSREDQLRFKLKIDGDQLDDLISYNQLMEYLEDKTDNGPLEDGLYRFKSIKDHKGPYTSSDPEYNGSSYNLLIEWETGEHTWEPLSNIIASDPYTCTVYAKEHDLLNTPGWKLLKRHARTARRLIRTLKKSKYRQAKAPRKYKHRWEVPRDYAHVLQLDIQNGNNKWKDAIDLEIEQIKEYQVFKDYEKAVYEKNKITNAPEGHQKIRVHFVFDVKHCGKFKARLVADGHLTKEPMETVYSGVVSIRNLRLAMFLAELNDLELWGADVGNAYLQALTREKLYIVGGPEFEALQGHVLVMYKALYGTRSGGACWHDKFFDILHDMSFKPSKADPDIWMKPSKDGSHYEYIAVYVDDLAICMKDPKAFCDTLKEKYKLKLKGVGPINYYLGCGYTRDEDGTLVADPRKYVEKILESYEKTFAEKPKKSKTPLVGGDHPESDTSDFCNQDQIKQYQTFVGQIIWLSGLGRFDIAVHVMTMSRFRQQPRIGHLERLKKIVGYLANLPHGALRFRLHEPDYSNLPHKEYDWQRTVYRGAKEEIPHDIPEPKGKHATTSTYVDANLHHDQVTGKAVTACLHMVNATPSHWHTKRQATVDTATFGSEFVAARIATDQIIDLMYTLMYLGVPVRSKSYMFGDKKSVVDSASIPTSTLSKKSTLASYHRVREAIAEGYIQFNWKDGKSNPADILSKHWEFANIWPLLKPLLFWKGDTNELNAKAKGSDRISVKKNLV